MRMAVFLSSIMLCNATLGQVISRQQLRSSLLRAIEHKTTLDSLAVQLDLIENKTPAQECYLGMCNALYCQYDDGNWAKLKHVMKSKNHLNNAIERDPADPELRFMRLMLEHFLPAFLGMNKHIPDDLKVIFANLDFVDADPALKKRVIDFLLWCKRCSPQQEQILQSQLADLKSAR
jgi:hypothetical protein